MKDHTLYLSEVPSEELFAELRRRYADTERKIAPSKSPQTIHEPQVQVIYQYVIPEKPVGLIGEKVVCSDAFLNRVNHLRKFLPSDENEIIRKLRDEMKKTKIEDFLMIMKPHMSSRLYSCLFDCRSRNCRYIEDVCERTLYKIRNAGMKTYQELVSIKERFFDMKKETF